MEACVSRSFVVAFIALLALACERDPASNVKIIARPTTPPGSAAAANSQPLDALPEWRPEFCTLQPEEKSGSSKFSVAGKCAFNQTGNVKCRAAVDDYYVTVLRKAAGETTVSMYINVEAYKGPGKYPGTQIFLTVQNGTSYYYWSNDSVRTTIGPALKYLDVPETRLEAEPPNTGTETISGRLWCGEITTSSKL
jgi:hypothetical protein